jgi:hypothetical protein
MRVRCLLLISGPDVMREEKRRAVQGLVGLVEVAGSGPVPGTSDGPFLS